MVTPIQILLVEDNEDDYEATLRSFRRNRFVNPIKWCRNGQEALDYLSGKDEIADAPAAQKPDLILLDLNMPGIDGRHVLHIIKADATLRSIPVIVLTTSTDAKDIAECYSMGANSYIQKPVSLEGLTDAIRIMTDYWFDVAILPRRVDDK
jgi:two-component system response regulator